MPKAAVIKNSRFYFYPAGVYFMNNLSPIKDPVFYDPLPLYHSAGGTVGVGFMMVFGFTIVIRKKFSVRNFWKDCCDHNCNVGDQVINGGRTLLFNVRMCFCREPNILARSADISCPLRRLRKRNSTTFRSCSGTV